MSIEKLDLSTLSDKQLAILGQSIGYGIADELFTITQNPSNARWLSSLLRGHGEAMVEKLYDITQCERGRSWLANFAKAHGEAQK